MGLPRSASADFPAQFNAHQVTPPRGHHRIATSVMLSNISPTRTSAIATPEALFASASRDGVISIWVDDIARDVLSSPQKIRLLYTLNYHDTYVEKRTKRVIFPISHLFFLQMDVKSARRPAERPTSHRRDNSLSNASATPSQQSEGSKNSSLLVLVAAIGTGFSIFDVLTGQVLASCPNAHDCDVSYLTPLYGGSCLVTAAIDSTIRLFHIPLAAVHSGTFIFQ